MTVAISGRSSFPKSRVAKVRSQANRQFRICRNLCFLTVTFAGWCGPTASYRGPIASHKESTCEGGELVCVANYEASSNHENFASSHEKNGACTKENGSCIASPYHPDVVLSSTLNDGSDKSLEGDTPNIMDKNQPKVTQWTVETFPRLVPISRRCLPPNVAEKFVGPPRICDPDGILQGVLQGEEMSLTEVMSTIHQFEELHSNAYLSLCGKSKKLSKKEEAEALEIQVGIQMAVAMVKKMDLSNYNEKNSADPVADAARDFAHGLHDLWGVGGTIRDCGDTGILLFISVQDRAVFVSTGSAVRKVLTEERMESVVDSMKPHLRNSYYDDAIVAAILHMHNLLEVGAPAAGGRETVRAQEGTSSAFTTNSQNRRDNVHHARRDPPEDAPPELEPPTRGRDPPAISTETTTEKGDINHDASKEPAHSKGQDPPDVMDIDKSKVTQWTVETFPNLVAPTPTKSPHCRRPPTNADEDSVGPLRVCDPDGILQGEEMSFADVMTTIHQFEELHSDASLSLCRKSPTRKLSKKAEAEALELQVGIQMAVALVKKMDISHYYGSYSKDPVADTARDFARGLHDLWGVGKTIRGCGDTGILLFLSVDDRAVFVSTGSAVRKVLTEERMDSVIDSMKPHLRNGYYDAAIQAAIFHMHNLLEEHTLEAAGLEAVEAHEATNCPPNSQDRRDDSRNESEPPRRDPPEDTPNKVEPPSGPDPPSSSTDLSTDKGDNCSDSQQESEQPKGHDPPSSADYGSSDFGPKHEGNVQPHRPHDSPVASAQKGTHTPKKNPPDLSGYAKSHHSILPTIPAEPEISIKHDGAHPPTQGKNLPRPSPMGSDPLDHSLEQIFFGIIGTVIVIAILWTVLVLELGEKEHQGKSPSGGTDGHTKKHSYKTEGRSLNQVVRGAKKGRNSDIHLPSRSSMLSEKYGENSVQSGGGTKQIGHKNEGISYKNEGRSLNPSCGAKKATGSDIHSSSRHSDLGENDSANSVQREPEKSLKFGAGFGGGRSSGASGGRW